MSKLVTLGVQIALIMRVCLGADGDLINNLKSISIESHDFLGVVGEQADFADPKVMENLCAYTIVAKIRSKAQLFVCLHGIETLLLEFVGVDFCGKPYPSPLLAKVKQDAPLLSDMSQSGMKLAATVTAARSKNIASETLRVHSY